MRLLNTDTLEFEEFYDETPVRYAILSHRWEKDEVTLQDMVSNPKVSEKHGHRKIRELCAKAKASSLEYAWIDTCCIDKSSSAELQEAINSMFRWYRNAVVCFAFLCDWFPDESSWDYKPLEESEWFTRGWTLQELIAPRHIEFFDMDWVRRGTRATLSKDLARTTRVPEEILCADEPELSDYSIAERMSWASGRKTTRLEDRAYSLFGLFDVNMPMLYGEGEKFFIRLQEEIFRKTPDRSILAWTGVRERYNHVFAPSPDNFPLESAQRKWKHRIDWGPAETQAVTSKGINIHLELTPWTKPDVYLAILDHWQGGYAEGIFICPVGDRKENIHIRVGGRDHEIFRGDFRKLFRDSRCLTRYVRITLLRATNRSLGPSLITPPVPDFQPEIPGLGIESQHRGRAGLVDIVDLPHYDMVHRVRRIVLGLGFDWCLTIVLELEGDLTPRAEDRDRENIGKKAFSRITCLEPHGWLTFHLSAITKSGTPNRDWFWPLKLEANDGGSRVYHIEIHLGSVAKDVSRCLLLTVACYNSASNWKVILSDHRIPSFCAKEGYSSWAAKHSDGHWIKSRPGDLKHVANVYHQERLAYYDSVTKDEPLLNELPNQPCKINACHCLNGKGASEHRNEHDDSV